MSDIYECVCVCVAVCVCMCVGVGAFAHGCTGDMICENHVQNSLPRYDEVDSVWGFEISARGSGLRSSEHT